MKKKFNLFFPLLIATAIVGTAYYLFAQQFRLDQIILDQSAETSEVTSSVVKPTASRPQQALIQPQIKQPRTAKKSTKQPAQSSLIGYKWIDGNGQTHYGDNPYLPKDIEVNAVFSQQNLSVVSSKTRTPIPQQFQRQERANYVRKSVHNNHKAERQAATSKSAACQRAEERLDWIKSKMRSGYKLREADRLHRKELIARADRHKFCD